MKRRYKRKPLVNGADLAALPEKLSKQNVSLPLAQQIAAEGGATLSNAVSRLHQLRELREFANLQIMELEKQMHIALNPQPSAAMGAQRPY